jgi:hypothetical protein
MVAEVVVEHLKHRKCVPRVWWLSLQQHVQVNSKQRPEYLGVLDHCIRKPWERLERME